MNEARIYADNFGAAFSEETGFLHFLRERTNSGWWKREDSRDLHFIALDDESENQPIPGVSSPVHPTITLLQQRCGGSVKIP